MQGFWKIQAFFFITLNAFILGKEYSLVLEGQAAWQAADLQGMVIEENAPHFFLLRPQSREWQQQSNTELLLHFNQPRLFDTRRRYRFLQDYQLSSRSVQGQASLEFSGGKGLLMSGSENSLLGSLGSSGYFTIDFWFHPHYSADGEFLFEWNGAIIIDGQEIEQRLSAYFSNQSLVWQLENVFFHGSQLQSKLELKSDALIPDRWYSHSLIYNGERNMIELQINNRSVDVAYTTLDGRAEGEPRTLLVSNPYRYPFSFGNGFHGLLDEFRISTGMPPSEPQYHRQAVYQQVASAVFGPFDLGRNDSSLLQLNAHYKTPEQSKILFFAKIDNQVIVQNQKEKVWKRLELDSDLENEFLDKGRYLWLKVMFLGDRTALEAPWLKQVKIDYQRPTRLPSPLNLSIKQVASDALYLQWHALGNTKVAGYQIFIGREPQVYLGAGSVIDVGQETEYLLQDLQVNQQYFITVAAYDDTEPKQQLGLHAPEQNVHILPYFEGSQDFKED